MILLVACAPAQRPVRVITRPARIDVTSEASAREALRRGFARLARDPEQLDAALAESARLFPEGDSRTSRPTPREAGKGNDAKIGRFSRHLAPHSFRTIPSC